MSEIVLDLERTGRIGLPEAVHCEMKSPEQIDAIVTASGEASLLLTRLAPERYERLAHATRAALDYDPVSRTAIKGEPAQSASPPAVAIVAAGTSDVPVAREAARTLLFHGTAATVIADVGVAGLWRLMARLEDIRAHQVVVAIAGMEGALFSVLGGLVAAPVVAVPTSVGYGVSAGGQAALTSALASCAPGVTVVNIDNGYGAACAALRILRRG